MRIVEVQPYRDRVHLNSGPLSGSLRHWNDCCPVTGAINRKANTKRTLYAMLSPVDEGRKRVLLIAATILAARKLAQYDKPCPAVESAIADGVAMAERIMAKIDSKYPERT